MSEVAKVVCLYHKNCADGRTAAWALLKAHPNAELHAVDYGDTLPQSVTGADVYLVDYSLPKAENYDVLLAMANSLTVIDHHKTAFKELLKFCATLNDNGRFSVNQNPDYRHIDYRGDRANVSFDTRHSGAYLTWSYFHGLKNIPAFLLQVEDRDLWKFNRQGTREMHAYLQSKDFSFDAMDEVCDWTNWEEAIKVGRKILEPHDRQVREFVEKDKDNQQVLKTHYGDTMVPVFALPSKKWYSDVTNAAVKDVNIAANGVAVAWTILPDSPDTVDYRITSNSALLLAGEIAMLYGGGGHDGAAGFKIPADKHVPGSMTSVLEYVSKYGNVK